MNRTTDKTPYELWHNQKPKLKFLRVFGCTAYVHNKTRKHKFDKSIKGILVGYVPNGYKIFIAKTRKFIVARDVIFDEVNFKTTRQELDDMIKIDRNLGENTDNLVQNTSTEHNSAAGQNRLLHALNTKISILQTQIRKITAKPHRIGISSWNLLISD
jgi:hypothetical protein